jgi:hypothetical protein
LNTAKTATSVTVVFMVVIFPLLTIKITQNTRCSAAGPSIVRELSADVGLPKRPRTTHLDATRF